MVYQYVFELVLKSTLDCFIVQICRIISNNTVLKVFQVCKNRNYSHWENDATKAERRLSRNILKEIVRTFECYCSVQTGSDIETKSHPIDLMHDSSVFANEVEYCINVILRVKYPLEGIFRILIQVIISVGGWLLWVFE